MATVNVLKATRKTLAILQARISSTRLPGKVLLPILGEPMLFRQIERVNRCARFDKLIVATSSDLTDDPLAFECTNHQVECFRWSLDDVLDRFVQAAKRYQPETVVRLTGDCPLADPELIDKVIEYFWEGDFDYVSNCDPPTFPDGLDVEVIKFSCLETAHREAVLPSHREHVTPFIRSHPERFRLGNYACDTNRSQLRWTVDESEDLEFVRSIYEMLYPAKPDFRTDDILNALEKHRNLQTINSKFERNEGVKKSLVADVDFLDKTDNVNML
jgi:spore coat polysaccharide biosynthesis protein SpsF (cytidylyltransferase family)